MKLIVTWMTATLLGAFVWLSDTSFAHANLNDCGGIFLSGDSNCEYREKEKCMTECKTETVETSCAAKTYVSCENSCTSTASVDCESSCGEVCTTDCETQITATEPPNCMGLCQADCKQTCEGGGRGRRGACCAHSCNAKCEDKCKNAAPMITKSEQCTETCTNACSGSCTAQANTTCQVDCQIETFDECETELVETCKTTCEDEGGAIFCDGQFVNASNANTCASQLKATFDFDIDVKGSFSSTVDSTKKKSKQLCSVAYAGADGGGTGTAALFGLLAGALTLQRVRRQRARG